MLGCVDREDGDQAASIVCAGGPTGCLGQYSRDDFPPTVRVVPITMRWGG